MLKNTLVLRELRDGLISKHDGISFPKKKKRVVFHLFNINLTLTSFTIFLSFLCRHVLPQGFLREITLFFQKRIIGILPQGFLGEIALFF